jgi:hypothetical protein
VRWFDDETNPTTFLKALEEVRRDAISWRYQHVQAIVVATDQYAEAAAGNREFFLNKLPNSASKAKYDIPMIPSLQQRLVSVPLP